MAKRHSRAFVYAVLQGSFKKAEGSLSLNAGRALAGYHQKIRLARYRGVVCREVDCPSWAIRSKGSPMKLPGYGISFLRDVFKS